MDKGQVSIDFLIAISIFVIGLVLLISQVPMLFTPLQTVSTDIQPVAYRTSMILAEDGGICNKGGSLTSEWDDCDPECISRIGLAMKAHGWASSEDIIPNNLSIDKIEALNNETKMSKSNITEKLGLFVIYNGNPLNYSYNISLKAFNGSFITNSTGVPLLQVGDSIPESGATVEKIERIIAIDNSTGLTNCTKIGDVNCSKLVVCIWR